MNTFHIRPLTEQDLASMVAAAGGTVAHPDATRRQRKGADFVLQNAVIELKFLSEDGFLKTKRQHRLASLFREEGFEAPVVVLDRENLSVTGQRKYDRIIEGPIKTEVASARKQLKETRRERPDATLSVLWVVNNGYTQLNHEELLRLVVHRVKNDTRSIDGVIVGGCYFHSDGFDNIFLWPLAYVPIRLVGFPGYDLLHGEWNRFAEQFMTSAARGVLGSELGKGPVMDTQFEVERISFVKPAPPIGGESEFFPLGRPRESTSLAKRWPPVALTFPKLTRDEWSKMKNALPGVHDLCENYEDWLKHERRGRQEGTPVSPFVSVPITVSKWRHWCEENGLDLTMISVRDYANCVFLDRLRATHSTAREMKEDCILPARYFLAMTHEIGQDKANDLSQIAIITHRLTGEAESRTMIENTRIDREHAIMLASSYAVSEGVDTVMWSVCKKYAWR